MMTSNLNLKSALLGCVCCLMAGTATAENNAANDPLYQLKAFEVNIGVGSVLNTLDGTFFATNNTSPGAFAGPLDPILGTSILDLGIAGRAALKFSQPQSENTRVFVETEISSASEGSTFSPSIDGTYPGSYDDGYLVPANFSVEQDIDTETFQFRAGQEWATSDAWRVRGAIQVGKVSQDITGTPIELAGDISRVFTTDSNNTQLGFSVGASHYSTLNARTGLRLSADMGVFRNDFTYSYSNVEAFGFLDQSNSASDIGVSGTTKISATFERTLENNSLVSIGVGLENFHNVGNGMQTFLNPEGTATTAVISKGTISTVFFNLGYTHRF